LKKLISILLTLTLIFVFSACEPVNIVVNYEAEYTREFEGITLNVFNWGEYISDGSEGTLNVNKEFERLTGIKINYTTYDSNESMYSKLKGGGVSFDIVIPSDYMIERLINEDMLVEFDPSELSNYKYIDEKYKNLYFDPDNKYSVPYNVGMVGLLYNTTMVEGTPDSWSIMWNKKYSNNILNFNNPRDAFAIAQFLLGIDINTTNPTPLTININFFLSFIISHPLKILI